MLKLTKPQWRLFERLRRKHKVSKRFLQLNLHDIRNFVWYEIRPRIVIRHYAIRKGNRVFLEYYRLRRVLYDQNNRKLFQRKRLNIKQWSKRVVAYLRRWLGVEEYVVEELISKKKEENTLDITNELKRQLELLKNGRRGTTLMELQKKGNKLNGNGKNPILTETENRLGLVTKTVKTADKSFSVPNVSEQHNQKCQEWQNYLESTPEKQITAGSDFLTSIQRKYKYCSSSDITDDSRQGEEVENNSYTEKNHLKTNGSFLDVLMSKVVGGVNDKTINSEPSFKALGSKESSCETLASLDSNDGFLGFDETERIPGMLMTPVVPQSNKNKSENSAFVSEMLNEYMRVNLLESDYKIEQNTNQSPFKKTDLEGLVTPKSVPPPLHMPAVPETLLKLRTVAERKQYLQKFSKNHRLSIINNEAAIYRELQRKIKTQKAKSTSQAVFQSKSSPMSFSRNGWQAASFVNTEFNKYYYQMIDIDRGKYSVRLRGVQGNNESFRKKPYLSHGHNNECPQNCLDRTLYKNLKAIKTNVSKNTKKLNQDPLKAVLKPCPLLFKPFQKPLDDDTAVLLLSGGSMAVVQMPLIELEVFPEQGKPLHEVAKRYLQHILPHHDISREWAEFSVSALQTPTTILQQVEEQTKASPLRKSFTFIIPYNNDRSQILVRRVVDRSEKLDQLFEQKHDISETSMKDFTFRRNLDVNATATAPDAIAMDCADILSDMINTVAISCSENSFINEDPHGMYDDADSLDDVQIQSNQQKTSTSESYGLPSAANNKKQNRLLMELKRLNATIIDAAVKKDNETRSCNKEYCSLGCVCSSLESGYPLRDHCGKAKCVLECTCKSSNQSRIMRLETDGRCITTEDAFMLRRKATARLARMEKEFTSTVVLTGNETLLINETNNDKKRRCTKTPKRYEDLGDTDRDDESNQRITPKKFATMDNNTEHCVAIGVEEWEEPIFVKDTVLEQLRHCTVNLTRLEETGNMVTWCMVHELYKCFCKGRALEGKAFIVEKEETNVTTVHSNEKKEDNLSKESGEIKVVDNKTIRPPRNYSFEKTEKRRKIETIDLKNNDIEDEAWEQSNNNIKNVLEKDTRELTNTPDSIISTTGRKRRNTESDTSTASTKRRRTIEEVKQRYYLGKPEWCRRQVPIPRRMYMHTNRNRRRQVLNFIKSNENPETRLLLNEHIMRSVYYHQAPEQGDKTHRKSQETAKPNLNTNDEEEQRTEKLLQKLFNIPEANLPLPNKRNERDLEEVIELIHDDNDDDENNQEKSKKPNITRKCSKSDESLAVDNQATTSSVINFKKFASLSGEIVPSSRTTPIIPNQLNKDGNSAEKNEFPKISSPFSLNLNPTNPMLNENSLSETRGGGGGQQQHNHQSKKSSSNVGAVHKTMLILAKELKMTNDDFQALYNDIIRCMNGMVCKKMYEVSEAFKRDNISIPQPRAGVLCIMRWSNFLAAFMQHCLFMWQVKMKDEHKLLLVTLNNMMPLVVDALGVVNIMALKIDKLPLMARMLLTQFQNQETHNLGVIMQGNATYWLVKGFIRGEAKHACFKPNPQTRPQLTKKINILCSLLVEQRVREEKLKMLKKVGNNFTSSPTTSTTSTPTNISETNNNNNNSASQIGQQPVNNESVSKANNNKGGKETDAVFTGRKKANLDSSFACINNINSTTAVATADVCTKNTESGGEVTFKVRSNIELRKIQQNDVEELHLPECHKYDHKWLVLDLHDDFSHIFVPEFKELLSLDRIHKVMAFAKQKQKIIKMQFFNSAPFDVFVTPKSAKKVYVGPLKLTAKQPLLILLQSVDGQMMMRELYQQKHNINNKMMKPTKAFWLLSINGQMHLEVDINDSRINEMIQQRQTATTAAATYTQQQNKEENSFSLHVKKANDDEDCIIIENNLTPTNVKSKSSEVGAKSKSKERYNFTIETVNNDTLQIRPQSITLPPGLCIPTNVSPYTLQHLSAINTTIKPLNTIASSSAPPCGVTYVRSGGCMEVIKRENNRNLKRAIRLTSESGLAPSQPPPPPPPLIAPTTTSSVLITKVVSLNSARNSLLLNKTNPPGVTMSTSNTILSSIEPIITNATSTMAGTPIISCVYSVSAASSKGTTTKTNTINSCVKNPIIRRRFSTICPSNKFTTSTTTKTTVREKFLMSKPLTQLREVVVGSGSNIEQNKSHKATDGEKLHPSTQLREVIVGGGGSPVHTIGCTTITKLTDTTMMVVANTNAIKSLPTASVSSDASLLKKTKTTTTTTHDKYDETIIRDLQMKSYPIAPPVIPSRPSNVKTVTTTTTTSTTTTTCNNVKVLYKKLPADAATTATTTTTNVVSGTLVQLDKMQAAKLNTKISNVTPNPNNPIVLNKWAIPTPLNDNNNTLQFRIINKNQNATSTANSSSADGNNKLLQYNISSPSPSITDAAAPATDAASDESLCVENEIHSNVILKQVTGNQPLIPMTGSITTITKASSTSSITINSNITKLPKRLLMKPSAKNKNTPDTMSIKTPNCKATTTPTLPTVMAKSTTTKAIQNAAEFLLNTSSSSSTSTNTNTTPPNTSKQCTNEDNGVNNSPPSYIQYGYVIAPNIDRRFVAKRVKFHYFLKFPNDGIRRFEKMDSVSNYLNKYLVKDKDCNHKLPAVWKFLPASQSIQIQNYKKSLNRKVGSNDTHATATATSTVPANMMYPMGNNIKTHANSSTSSSGPSLLRRNTMTVTDINETILIED